METGKDSLKESRKRAIDGYSDKAQSLSRAWADIDPHMLLDPVMEALPTSPCRVLDVGAGDGRDAAWFAIQGHTVVAVEPANGLREIGQKRHGSDLLWIDDRLPQLEHFDQVRQFDLIIANGVWHHLTPDDQITALSRIHTLLSDAGLIILALRHGPIPTDRPGFAIDTNALISHAETEGLRLRLRKLGLRSHQSANRKKGVTWDWLVFGRE
ncbi:MAG: class I SAM-dependent methyltransferase [Paracoccaceae bacterium]